MPSKDTGNMATSSTAGTRQFKRLQWQTVWQRITLARPAPDCPYLQESDTDGYSRNFPLKSSPVNETVLGLLPKLSGCDKVTDGPSNATPQDSGLPLRL